MITRIGTGALMSQAVIHAGTVYVAGQVGAESCGGTITAETNEILGKIDSILQAAGTDKSRLLSATIWLTDMSDYAEMNAAWSAWLPEGAAPARATVGVSLARPGLRVEIMVTAAL